MRIRGIGVAGALLALVGAMLVCSLAQAGHASTPRDAREAGTASAVRDFGRLPLNFVENGGQWDSRVAYAVQGKDASVYFTSTGVTFSLAATGTAGDRRSAPRREHVLKLDFVGAARTVRPEGRAPTSAVVSYFRGGRDDWSAGLKTFSSIVYRDL